MLVISEIDYPSVIEAARLGAEWAWTAIYRDLSPMVLRYLRAHGAREPEDVLGDVFVQVVRKLPSFVGGGRDMRAWVFTIARNRLVDEWRHLGRRLEDPVPHDILALNACGTGDSEDDAMRHLAEERVLGVLGRLTPDQRDVLFLRICARLTVEEVAQVVGKRPGAVKMLQARGLAAIRREISKEAVTL